jgi:hypothetical protein
MDCFVMQRSSIQQLCAMLTPHKSGRYSSPLTGMNEQPASAPNFFSFVMQHNSI